MGSTIQLPTKLCSKINVVQIPQIVFGKRITIQAHEIKNPKRGTDVCDGHGCDQTDVAGDVKFFSRSIDISKI